MDWNKVIKNHGAAFILYAKQWTGSHSDAEDVVQTAIIRLCRSCPGKKDIPPGWFYRAIRYAALDHLKSKRRREVREETAAETLYSGKMFEPTLGDTISDDVQTALMKLPEEQREVVIMKVWGDLTFREIAASLDISMNTAASRYRYAMNTLKSALSSRAPVNEKLTNGTLVCEKII